MASNIQPTFVEPEQLQMLAQLRANDYDGLMNTIQAVEQQKARDVAHSRIGKNVECHDDGVFLLSSVDRRVLQATLEGTLPQLALADLKNIVIKPTGHRHWKAQHDEEPANYQNWIADEHGLGLGIQEMFLFLDDFEIITGLVHNPTREQQLRDVLNKEYLTLVKSKAPDPYFSSLSAGEWKTLKVAAKELVDHYRNRILPEARRQNLTHVTFKAEFGWAIKAYQRCHEHTKLIGSPPVFGITYLLVRHLHPTRKFRLHQFYLFHVVREEHAGIGECIGSQLCASYTTYGGFNHKQAGLNTIGAGKLVAKEWRTVRSFTENSGRFGAAERNLKGQIVHWTDRRKEAEEEETRRRSCLESEEHGEAQRQIEKEVEPLATRLELGATSTATEREQLEKKVEQEESRDAASDAAYDSLADFAKGMQELAAEWE